MFNEDVFGKSCAASITLVGPLGEEGFFVVDSTRFPIPITFVMYHVH